MRQDASVGLSGRRAALEAAVIGLAAAIAQACSSQTPPVRVAAASDLQFALSDVADQFAKETGQHVELVFGSSGTLARQIQDGAPFALFLSADERFVDQLAQAGRTRDAGVPYAIGRIALFAPPGSPLIPSQGFDGLARLVQHGQVTRFAIANPHHAPYGRAAEQALRKRGLWEALQPTLVLGENVSQAAQFASAGNATGGIIAYSLALAPAMRDKGSHFLIPEDDHVPLTQRMVLTAGADTVAEQFYRYLQGQPARATLSRYGFVPPSR
jgi:molybdate transport system substrate-binding protein